MRTLKIKLLSSLALASLLPIAFLPITSCEGPNQDDDDDGDDKPFDVKVECDVGSATLSNKQATIGQDFNTIISIDNDFIFEDITISNKDGKLKENDYSFFASSMKLTVYAQAITSNILKISLKLKTTTFTASIFGDVDNIKLSKPTWKLGQDFQSKILVADTTKQIETVKAEVNGQIVDSDFDEETKTITIDGDDITSTKLEIFVTTTNRDYEDYIYERTFTIRGNGYASIVMEDQFGQQYSASGLNNTTVLGTAWILDDSTPNNNSDYRYYVGTNFHVVRGIDKIKDDIEAKLIKQYQDSGFTYVSTEEKESVYYFADASVAEPTTQICDISKYIKSPSVQRQDDTNFLFNDEVSPGNYYPCVDFHVYDIDLSNGNQSMLNKLDNLNYQKKELGYINKFAYGDDTKIQKKNKYIGGYPARESSSPSVQGGKWTFHQIDIDGRQDYNKGESTHLIDSDDSNYNHIDVSAGTIYADTQDPQWMGGGASGSMIITEDYEVCAIYWGHRGSGSVYKPCASYLQFDKYDFIKNFLTHKS